MRARHPAVCFGRLEVFLRRTLTAHGLEGKIMATAGIVEQAPQKEG